MVRAGEQDKYVMTTEASTRIEVKYMEEGKQYCIFRGLITNIDIQTVNDTYYVEVEGISTTYEMDLKPKRRSFQNKDMLYKELVRKVIEEYEGADFIDEVAKSKKLDKFIIQYDETDWQFLKRMVSHFNGALLPDYTSDKPKFWFGVPNGGEKGSLNEFNYCVNKGILGGIPSFDVTFNGSSSKPDEKEVVLELENHKIKKIADEIAEKYKKLTALYKEIDKIDEKIESSKDIYNKNIKLLSDKKAAIDKKNQELTGKNNEIAQAYISMGQLTNKTIKSNNDNVEIKKYQEKINKLGNEIEDIKLKINNLKIEADKIKQEIEKIDKFKKEKENIQKEKGVLRDEINKFKKQTIEWDWKLWLEEKGGWQLIERSRHEIYLIYHSVYLSPSTQLDTGYFDGKGSFKDLSSIKDEEYEKLGIKRPDDKFFTDNKVKIATNGGASLEGVYYQEMEKMQKLADIIQKHLEAKKIMVFRKKYTPNYEAGNEGFNDKCLNDRTKDSNSKRPTLHFAIHSNAVNKVTRGCEILHKKKDTPSEKVAEIIKDKVLEAYKDSDKSEFKYKISASDDKLELIVTSPSVLVEVGYHDNLKDVLWIMNNMPEIGKALADGIEYCLENILN